MLLTYRSIILCLICSFGSSCTQPKPSEAVSAPVSESEKLIEQLAARFPPAHPNGDIDGTGYPDPNSPAGQDAARVHRAIEQLSNMGMKAFPALVAASDDKQYSYSDTSSCWWNYTVGDACREIIEKHVENFPGPKPEPFKGEPSFTWHVFRSKGVKSWWATHSKMTLRDMHLEAIQWEIEQDKVKMNDGLNFHRDLLGKDLASRQQILKLLVEPTTAP
jgi:hypothetical protein